MKASNTPYKTFYTALLVVIYAAFFIVHCYFKMSLGAFNGRYAATTIGQYKQSGDSKQASFAKDTKKNDRKNNRLNKRFHPENNYLIATELLYSPLAYSVQQKIRSFYNNPTQARICISKTLRGPPPALV